MSGYQLHFQDAKAKYDNLELFDVDAALNTLDTALFAYSKSQIPDNLNTVQSAFEPIAEHYSNLTSITIDLQTFLEKASKYVVDSQDKLENEERYANRVHPEESTESREILLGIVPTLKMKTIPYLLAAGVFMALLTIFLIFQMLGVSGQLNLPPALVQWWMTPAVGPRFYERPEVYYSLVTMVVAYFTKTIITEYYKSKRT